MTIYITDQPLGMTGPDIITISPIIFALTLFALTVFGLLVIGKLRWN